MITINKMMEGTCVPAGEEVTNTDNSVRLNDCKTEKKSGYKN
jgi:hypothetical protein